MGASVPQRIASRALLGLDIIARGPEARLGKRALRYESTGAVAAVGGVLVGWDSERTAHATQSLGSALRDTRSAHDLVLVRNRAEVPAPDRPWRSLVGTNADAEFSAYDEGLQLSGDQMDVVLLANDRLASYPVDYTRLLTPAVLSLVAVTPTMVGWLDRLHQPLRVLGHDVDVYCRSNFMLVNRKLLAKLRPIVSVTDALFDGAASVDWRSFASSGIVGADSEYNATLLRWLTGPQAPKGVWREAQPLSEHSWPALRLKLKSILNEHLLSARLLRAGGTLLSVEQAIYAAALSNERRAAYVERCRTRPERSWRLGRHASARLPLALRVSMRRS